MHKVSIFGSGYVGLVTGACLAEVGNDVLCVDTDAAKIARLRGGEIPIYEPGLEELVQKGIEAGRLAFTTDVAQAVAHGLYQFIAVGTPPDEDGSADLRQVRSVAEGIGRHMAGYRIVVTKSTVPVGTAAMIREEIAAQLEARALRLEYDVVSNPEFLKEGAAVEDFLRPDRVIIGTDNPRTLELMRALYGPFNRSHDRVVAMDIASAELTKYAANAMLATKISFMNEIANIAERVGADVESVRVGIGSDPRIGYHFIYPGVGYGGSCFPKDVRALAHTARARGYTASLLEAVEEVNNRQKLTMFEKIKRHFNGALQGRVIALWGLSFKPQTDDMREAPSRALMEALWAAGASVRAFDPVAMDEARRIYGDRADLVLCASEEATLQGADALLVATEWKRFWNPDFNQIKAALREPVIFDGRNIYDPNTMAELGFRYYGVGRGESE